MYEDVDDKKVEEVVKAFRLFDKYASEIQALPEECHTKMADLGFLQAKQYVKDLLSIAKEVPEDE